MSVYKSVHTKRGFNYHYLLAPPQSGKPTILFIHGFPSTSYDWHHQIDYFSAKGFGLIVPDELGYGGTDKPTELKYYALNGMSADLIDILDAEHIDKVIVVGHDWGCAIVSRLSLLHSDRFLAFAWLAVGFVSPSPPEFNLEQRMAFLKNLFGSELFGYWTLFIQEEAATLIEKNIDSFLSVFYPADPDLWLSVMNIPRAFEDWVQQDKRAERAKYLSEEEYNTIRANILNGGLTAPLNWYKAMASNINHQDNLDIPEANYAITKPAFFGAALKDYVCLAKIGLVSLEPYAKDLTVVDFDTGHWVQLEEPQKVNEALEAWIESKV